MSGAGRMRVLEVWKKTLFSTLIAAASADAVSPRPLARREDILSVFVFVWSSSRMSV